MPVLLTGFSGLGTKISPDNTAPPEVTAAAREHDPAAEAAASYKGYNIKRKSISLGPRGEIKSFVITAPDGSSFGSKMGYSSLLKARKAVNEHLAAKKPVTPDTKDNYKGYTIKRVVSGNHKTGVREAYQVVSPSGEFGGGFSGYPTLGEAKRAIDYHIKNKTFPRVPLTRAEAHHEHFAHLRDREPAIVPSTSEETEQTIKDPAVIDAPVEAQGPDGGILSQEGKQEFNMILWGGAAVVALLLLRK